MDAVDYAENHSEKNQICGANYYNFRGSLNRIRGLVDWEFNIPLVKNGEGDEITV